MSTQFDEVKVLERCLISPPPSSVPTTSFPLTFLDILLFNCCPSQRVFLYQIPFSAAQFTDEILPQLKNSFSLALQRFYPFCGNAICPPEPGKPYILYKDGDSVPLLIAESSGVFSDFLRYGPKDATEIHPLVPPTPTVLSLSDTQEEITPLLAVQVTLFQNTGLSIGITYRHIVADGMSAIHFVRTWASIFEAKCNLSSVSISLPVLDKGVVKEPDGFCDFILEQWRAWGSPVWKGPDAVIQDYVRATFTLSRVEIELLKKWILAKYDNWFGTTPNFHLSSYVVTSAFVWVCLIQSLDVITPKNPSSKDEEQCHFCVLADGRNKYDLGIPGTYFGNCLFGHFVSISRCKFREEDCVAAAAELISQGVQNLKNEPFHLYRDSILKWIAVVAKGENMLTVASSPKLAEYDIDFGWGSPEKVEVVHIDVSGSISLSESRNEKGGIEIGLCRSRHEMEVFSSLFQSGVNKFAATARPYN